MQKYAVRRVLLAVPTLLLIVIFIFLLVRLIPGDVVYLLLSEQELAATDVDELREKLGLDEPVVEQFGSWFGGLFVGDWGESLYTGQSVLPMVVDKFGVTLELAILSLLVAVLFGVPIGVIAAIRQDTWLDYSLRSFAILGLSIPNFWLATLVIVYASIWWNWAPSLSLVPFTSDPLGNLHQFIIPASILGVTLSATVVRMTRAMMLEVLREDYVRTARAKGLRERSVVIRHALKNAMLPVVTIVGLQLAFLIGGTVIFESIFALPGTGRLLIEAIGQRDYPLIQGITLIYAGVVLLLNIGVDLSYGFFDPRVRYR